MKKLLGILLIFVLVFSLSACDNKGGTAKEQSAATPPQSVVESKDNTDSQPTQPTESTDMQTQSNPEIITRERAIELALSHAGLLHRSDIYDLDAELDREYGGVFWEVDFENGGYDYSYEINAVTEEIVRHQKERD